MLPSIWDIWNWNKGLHPHETASLHHSALKYSRIWFQWYCSKTSNLQIQKNMNNWLKEIVRGWTFVVKLCCYRTNQAPQKVLFFSSETKVSLPRYKIVCPWRSWTYRNTEIVQWWRRLNSRQVDMIETDRPGWQLWQKSNGEPVQILQKASIRS